jgi:iron complex outermembrane receptor protein
VRDAGDTDTPEGTLTNSGEEELNGAAAVGIQGAWGALLGDYGHFGSRLEIHEDPAEEPDFTGFQKVRHDYAHVHALLPSAHWRIEVDGGLQYNNRREFEEKDAVDPVLHLKLTTATLDVKAHHSPVGKMNGTIGAALMSQQNESDAEEKLIPDFTSDNVAGFIYEELALGRVNLTGGVRADARTLNVHVSEELGVAAQTRDFSTASGTLGAVWRAEEPWAVAVNIGRGWRAPTAFELFVDGVHEGTVRYEIGDATLDPEQSLNLDLSVRYIGPRVQAEIALYQNRIDNYIFLQPTGEVDDESGFTTFQHQQADATLQGGEFSVEGQATAWLILKAGADLVRGNNDKTDHPLPLMPADRLRIGTKFIQPRMGGVLNPYLALSTTFTADAERLESAELRTPGYSLVNAGVGGEFNVGEERATVDLVVDNLLDKSYRDHLSRYKEYELNPGQNVMLKIGVPFTLIRN